MAKKTKAELVDEGKLLNSTITDIRKTPHNFALLQGKEGVFLAAHKTKPASAMKIDAKSAGGEASKGAIGIVTMEGKTMNFAYADGETPPGMLGKKFRAHLKERGLNYKVIILDAKGNVLEGDEEDGFVQPLGTPADDEPVPNDQRTKLVLAYNKIAPGIKQAIT